MENNIRQAITAVKLLLVDMIFDHADMV